MEGRACPPSLPTHRRRRHLDFAAATPLQSNEQRYRLLEGKHTALAAEKEKLFQENETLRKVGPVCALHLPCLLLVQSAHVGSASC